MRPLIAPAGHERRRSRCCSAAGRKDFLFDDAPGGVVFIAGAIAAGVSGCHQSVGGIVAIARRAAIRADDFDAAAEVVAMAARGGAIGRDHLVDPLERIALEAHGGSHRPRRYALDTVAVAVVLVARLAPQAIGEQFGSARFVVGDSTPAAQVVVEFAQPALRIVGVTRAAHLTGRLAPRFQHAPFAVALPRVEDAQVRSAPAQPTRAVVGGMRQRPVAVGTAVIAGLDAVAERVIEMAVTDSILLRRNQQAARIVIESALAALLIGDRRNPPGIVMTHGNSEIARQGHGGDEGALAIPIDARAVAVGRVDLR